LASSNTRLNNKKFSKYFLLLVLFISVVAVGFLIPLVDAAHPPGKDFVTRTLPSATNEISFRDISNTAETSSTISVDTSTAASGFITITVTDADANYDTEGIDVVLSSVISIMIQKVLMLYFLV